MSKPKSKAGEPAPVPPAPPVPATTFLDSLKAALIARLQLFYSTAIAPLLDWRTLIVGGLAFFLLAHDVIAAKSFLMPVGIVCAVLAFTHWYRKTHMPYLDLAVIVTKAEEEPLAAAIVYAATRAFDVAIIFFFLFAAVR